MIFFVFDLAPGKIPFTSMYFILRTLCNRNRSLLPLLMTSTLLITAQTTSIGSFIFWICFLTATLISTKAVRLSLVGSNPKNNESPLPLEGFRGGWMDLILVMVLPRKYKNSYNSLRLGKRVAHANKNFWSLYLARHTNYSKLLLSLRVTHLTFLFH